MRVFIAEKPELGTAIAEALGNCEKKTGYYQCGDDIVTWCVGHLLTLASPEKHNSDYKKWDLSLLPLKLRPVMFEVSSDKKAQFKIVCDLIKKASRIVHAGDPDDQGQLIVDEILDYVDCKLPVDRVLISDLALQSVKKALANLKDNDDFQGLSKKALAQAVGDQIYGLNMTRAYTIATNSNQVIRCGRVQTPILGLIVSRYLSNKNHKKSYYYLLNAKISIRDIVLDCNLITPEDANDVTDEAGHIIDEDYINFIATQCKNKNAVIKSIKREEKEVLAPLPYSLLDLQSEMNEKHGLTAQETLDITQRLRQNYHAISYNRSDCNYLTEEQFEEAPLILNTLKSNIDFAKIIGEFCVPLKKGRAFNTKKVSAHTGIIPTQYPINLEKMNQQEKSVYDAIVLRYLIQFMNNKVNDTLKIIFNVCNDSFSYSAVKTKNLGWTTVYKKNEEGDNENINDNQFDVIALLKESDVGECIDTSVIKQETKPPAIYTEASLLEDLRRIVKYVSDPKIKELLIDKDKDKAGEAGGIGTPATRSTILENLKKSGYYIVDKKKLIPTELGISFIQSLPGIMTTPDMTALWHEQQREIEAGTLSIDSFLDDLEVFVSNLIANIDVSNIKVKEKKTKEKNVPKNSLGVNCPNCDKHLIGTEKVIFCSAECGFKIFRLVASKMLTDNQVISLIEKGKTSMIKGFKSTKNNKEFSAKLILEDKKTGKTKFEF